MTKSSALPEAESIEQILGKKSLSNADHEELAIQVRALLAVAEGREFLAGKVKTKRSYRNRSALFAHLVTALEESSKEGGTKLELPEIRLLTEMAGTSKLNEVPKWSAVRVLLAADGVAGRAVLGQCLASIAPKRELVAKFRKYAMDHLGSDGGESALRRLAETGGPSPGAPLAGEILAKVFPSALPAPKKVKPGGPVPARGSPSRIVASPGQVRAAERPAANPMRAEADLDRAESGLREILAALAERRALAAEVERLEDKQSDLRETARRLSREAEQAREKVAKRRKEISALSKENAGLLHRVEETEASLAETKSRATQDVTMARKDAEHAVLSFKGELWQKLRPHLSEALRGVEPKDDQPPEVRVPLRRLQSILGVLRQLGVVPDVDREVDGND